ncbi:UPF0149 family protein [Dyella nitratireducens]|uniref:YecA family protein n=1 Tax=Dyella nitratireducens TaxID=1849580 RepID=A0ABQ1FPV0_9GAMM|nr:UPF0149 family protein [Dyella nitratireducens]GGA23965.1 hypothetical protein GCM10010981_10430 [Dyella nitratireducens]GLQ43894.1 hypothetical protein GCM10007902_37440 [Dyella nitratireducens]
MTAPEPIGHDELDEVVAHLRLSIPASELHGSLCGLLAANGRPGKRSVLNALHLEVGSESVSEHDQDTLDQLVRQSEEELADPELGFEPLLPADDRPLPERADALVNWCRGFLGGFGLGGPDMHGKLSDEGREVLNDIGTIASSSLDFGSEEEDEDALIEVHEFVRMGAMLLFTECHIPDSSSNGTLH